MSTTSPYAYISEMVQSWPCQAVTGGHEDDSGCIYRLSMAERWLAAARQILPPDQVVISDYRCRALLDAAASEIANTGVNGWIYIFEDCSAIVATEEADTIRRDWMVQR